MAMALQMWSHKCQIGRKSHLPQGADCSLARAAQCVVAFAAMIFTSRCCSCTSRFLGAPVTLSTSAITHLHTEYRCQVATLWKAFHSCLLEMCVKVSIKTFFFCLTCKRADIILVCATFETVCFSVLEDKVQVYSGKQ